MLRSLCAVSVRLLSGTSVDRDINHHGVLQRVEVTADNEAEDAKDKQKKGKKGGKKKRRSSKAPPTDRSNP